MNEKTDSSWPLFLAAGCLVASALILLFYLPFAWIMKDGLGPDATESHGLVALGRFWREIRWIFCGLLVPTQVLGWFFYWWDSRRRNDPPAWTVPSDRTVS